VKKPHAHSSEEPSRTESRESFNNRQSDNIKVTLYNPPSNKDKLSIKSCDLDDDEIDEFTF